MGHPDVQASRSSSFSTTPAIHPPTTHLNVSPMTLLPAQTRIPQPTSSRSDTLTGRSPSEHRQPAGASALAPSMASKQSSSTLYQSARGSQNDLRQQVQSAYPPGQPQNHVEFILVASFDIDRGSIMEHQYPAPISSDESMLAELMLPEGTHNRTQDWTIFFLHKDPEQDEPPPPSSGQERAGTARLDTDPLSNPAEPEENDEALEGGPPLVYVLNLVNTKHDSNAKRGAVVKAMAICTRHPFLHIYKPLLLLALEEYFRAPTLDTLVLLYEAVNAMDLSLMPRFSTLERMILQSSTAKDLFVGRFRALIERSTQTSQAPTLVAKASIPRDTHEFESRIFYNGISVPVKIPTARAVETVGDFSIIKLIQTFSNPHATNPQPFALHAHLTTGGGYTHPIVVLANALITQKRIIFLGHNQPSGDVAEAVLAACALASGGVLRGFTRHAFPYTDLTKIDDLLKVPGFIAGVTNPAFANKPEWWDLLCDLSTGRMKISSKIEPPTSTEGIQAFQQQSPGAGALLASLSSDKAQDLTGDAVFMDEVLRNMTNRLGEAVIRSMWRDWVIKLTRMAAAFEDMVFGASALYIGGEQADAQRHGLTGHGYVWPNDNVRQRELAGNLYRIEGWRATRSYFNYKQDQIYLWNFRPIKDVDLHHHHDRLRTQKLSIEESAAIYLGLSAMIDTEAEINQLLTVTSESHGGIWYVSLGLFHPRKIVQYSTVELLDKIQDHEAGQHFWDKLSRFSKLAYLRIKGEKEGLAGGSGKTSTLSPQASALSPLSQNSSTAGYSG